MSQEIAPGEELPDGEPERGDVREDVTKQLALLFAHDGAARERGRPSPPKFTRRG